MLEIGVRPNQSAIRSKAGVMTAAALFYLSGAMETEAEPAAGDQNTTEQAPTPAPRSTTRSPGRVGVAAASSMASWPAR